MRLTLQEEKSRRQKTAKKAILGLHLRGAKRQILSNQCFGANVSVYTSEVQFLQVMSGIRSRVA